MGYFALPPSLPSSAWAADDLRGLDLPSWLALAFAFLAVPLPWPFFSVIIASVMRGGNVRSALPFQTGGVPSWKAPLPGPGTRRPWGVGRRRPETEVEDARIDEKTGRLRGRGGQTAVSASRSRDEAGSQIALPCAWPHSARKAGR